MIGPVRVHVDSKGIFDGLWRGERKCIDPKAADADLWIKIWEELHPLTSKEILVEVEHVKAHRTKKDKNDMSQFERFVAEGKRMLMSWQRQEQCWTNDLWQKREQKLCSKSEKRCMQRLQYPASFHCLVEERKDCEGLKPKPKEKLTFVDKKREEKKKHRTEWYR